MSQLRLPPTTDSVPMARRHAREQLRDSRADVDTVVLLVSEVVTNAVLHARSDVILTVHDLGATARVEVHDSSPVPPRLHRFAAESATGRGLRLLDQLALRWGADQVAEGLGKTVWFEVGSPGDAAWESFGDVLLAEGAFGDL
jgi:anti-sigma regulatory factor (Ser/Thr protein kinase)